MCSSLSSILSGEQHKIVAKCLNYEEDFRHYQVNCHVAHHCLNGEHSQTVFLLLRNTEPRNEACQSVACITNDQSLLHKNKYKHGSSVAQDGEE